MKKTYFLALLAVLMCGMSAMSCSDDDDIDPSVVSLSQRFFPDRAFREILTEIIRQNYTGNLTEKTPVNDLLAQITELDVSGQHIKDLTGLE